MERRFRSPKVVGRAQDVLDYLERNGPSTLADIASGTSMHLHIARYATVVLNLDGKAYIQGFRKVLRDGDRIPRHVAIFVAGYGINAQLNGAMSEEGALNFESTRHLQPVYVQWAGTRCPVETDEDDEVSS
jgi:uncharacterized metal-binding protein